MTPEKQQIAIAEACRWKSHDHPDCMALKQGWSMPEKWCMNPDGFLCLTHDRPDYLIDLNAMHAAEKTLDDIAFYNYQGNLYKVCGGYAFISSTAAQRAEAFLRTIGKWENAN